jgi:hypothetical protein
MVIHQKVEIRLHPAACHLRNMIARLQVLQEAPNLKQVASMFDDSAFLLDHPFVQSVDEALQPHNARLLLQEAQISGSGAACC